MGYTLSILKNVGNQKVKWKKKEIQNLQWEYGKRIKDKIKKEFSSHNQI